MRNRYKAALAVAVSLVAPSVWAGAHTWQVWEVFSNASGTIQFVELREAAGTPGETGIGGHQILANPSATSYTIVNSVASPTSNKSWLLATPGFAALPGAPTPNEIKASGFLFQLTDTSVAYTPFNTATWTAGLLPTDGIRSLQRPGPGQALAVTLANSPTNYAGQTGSVNAAPPIPGVPGLTVGKLAADGSSLEISFNTATCGDGNDHQILYGEKSGFPAALGGTFTLAGGTCNIGASSPYTWNVTPDAADGNGLVWFLVVGENNSAKEGPWGTQTGSLERAGPGTNGASNQCAVTNKDTASTCGN